jgi:hypothetical protein
LEPEVPLLLLVADVALVAEVEPAAAVLLAAVVPAVEAAPVVPAAFWALTAWVSACTKLANTVMPSWLSPEEPPWP